MILNIIDLIKNYTKAEKKYGIKKYIIKKIIFCYLKSKKFLKRYVYEIMYV